MKSRLLCVILLLPLLYCSVTRPDWGDDFAQYLLQARNIAEGLPMGTNGVVADPALPAFAVPAYPAGFPLLLLPFYSSDPTDTSLYFLVPALGLIVAGFAYFLLMQKRFSPPVALISTVMIAYHPVFLQAKSELLSDLPFLAFLLLGLQWLVPGKDEVISPRKAVSAGFALGAAMCMRLTGFVVFPALLVWAFSERGRLKPAALAGMIALAFFLLVHAVLFPIDLRGLADFYRDAIRAKPLLFSDQLVFYAYQLNALFWLLPLSWSGAVLLLALVIYLLRKRDALDLADWFLIAYFTLLLLVPYQGGGLRFLLPVFPILLRDLLTLARPLALPLHRFRIVLRFAYALTTGVLVFPGIVDWITGTQPIEGPQTAEGKKFLAIVKQRTPADAVIVCAKPRAIHWYTGRKATYLIDGVSSQETDSAFVRLGARYLVSEHSGRPGAFADDKMNDYLRAFGDRYKAVDSTKQLTLWVRK